MERPLILTYNADGLRLCIPDFSRQKGSPSGYVALYIFCRNLNLMTRSGDTRIRMSHDLFWRDIGSGGCR